MDLGRLVEEEEPSRFAPLPMWSIGDLAAFQMFKDIERADDGVKALLHWRVAAAEHLGLVGG